MGDYNAVERRSKSKRPKSLLSNRTHDHVHRTTKSNNVGKINKQSKARMNKTFKQNNKKKITHNEGRTIIKESNNKQTDNSLKQLEIDDLKLRKTLQAKDDELSEVFKAADAIEKERNFYFQIATQIERRIKQEPDSNLKKDLLSCLYTKDVSTINPDNVSEEKSEKLIDIEAEAGDSLINM